MTGITVEMDGLMETLQAFRGLERDLARQANSELRKAAGDCARGLIPELQASAASSGVPVAPRVASSARVKSDRLPAVAIGGSRRVGRGGAPAAALLWGSEHGPRGEVNHFGVEANAAGYWIAPAVERFADSKAVEIYKRAVYSIAHRWGLM